MKKKIIMSVILMVSIMLLCACTSVNKGDGTQGDDNAETTTEGQTGYNDGGLGWVFLCYEDKLYGFPGGVEHLTRDKFEIRYEGYQKAGCVETIDNFELPDVNFEASRVEVGAEIYVKDDKVLIYQNDYVYNMELREDLRENK